MKNIFKLFSIALIAGAMMFASCGDKDNNDDIIPPADTTPQEQQPQNDPTDTVPSIIVIFNDTIADLGIYQAIVDDSSATDTILFALVAVGKNAETGDAQLPQFQVGFQYSKNDPNKWSVNYIQYTENADHFATMKRINPKNPTEYICKTINAFQFTKFETSPVVVSFDADITMQSYYEYAAENVPEEEVSQKPLLVRVKNFRFANGKLR